MIKMSEKDHEVMREYGMDRGFEFVESRDVPEVLMLPSRKTKHSAGYDFMCPFTTVILPGDEAKIYTRVKAFMMDDEYLELHMRSSMAINYGLVLKNCTGIIDSDYYNNPENEGEIIAVVCNTGKDPVTIKAGTNFVQGIFCKYMVIAGDAPREMRVGGIGSTGK